MSQRACTFLFVAFVLPAASLRAQAASLPAPTFSRSNAIRLNAPPGRAFELFTPKGERAWAGKGWDPHSPCAKNGDDQEGMVFRNGGVGPLWIVRRLDRQRAVVEYVMVSEDLVTQLRAELSSAAEGDSLAVVSYRWTSLTEAGDRLAAEHDAHFEPMLAHWREAMNAVLAKERLGQSPRAE